MQIGKVSQQTGKFSQQTGKISQQTVKISQRSGKVSQQTGKVSQQVGKVSQQTGKVSQQSGKVSQHLFAVKWQVTINNIGGTNKKLKFSIETGSSVYHSCSATLNGEFYVFGGSGEYTRQVNLKMNNR